LKASVVTTNYHDGFITVAPDSLATQANRDPRSGTVAARQLELLLGSRYSFTSDELLFAVHAERNAISAGQIDGERSQFEAKPKACLRASPLVKTHGWGLHHDTQGRVAAIALEDPAYARFAADPYLKVVAGMRSRRG
jgi:hypothetical protein